MRLQVWNHRPSATLWHVELTLRFTAQEAAQLWRVFEPIDTAMQNATMAWVPSYQCGPSRYGFDSLDAAQIHAVDSFLGKVGLVSGTTANL
eukprot:SAG11_NODE_3927_length_2144_cov_13.208802_4_plen_91_part_00